MSSFGTAVPEAVIHCDGGSRGNGSEDSVGAYGYVLEHDGKTYEGSESFSGVTNNQMELKAVIHSLKHAHKLLQADGLVEVHSDSQYVVKGITEWRYGWESNNWVNSKKKPVVNKELWKELIAITNLFSKISWNWIKGHQDSGNLNDRADELCNISMDNFTANSASITEGFITEVDGKPIVVNTSHSLLDKKSIEESSAVLKEIQSGLFEMTKNRNGLLTKYYDISSVVELLNRTVSTTVFFLDGNKVSNYEEIR